MVYKTVLFRKWLQFYHKCRSSKHLQKHFSLSLKRHYKSFTEYAQNLNQDIKTKKKSKFHLKINVSLKLWGNTEQNDVMWQSWCMCWSEWSGRPLKKWSTSKTLLMTKECDRIFQRQTRKFSTLYFVIWGVFWIAPWFFGMSQKRRRRVGSVFLAQSIGLGGLNKWEENSQREACGGGRGRGGRLSDPSCSVFHNDWSRILYQS